MKMIVKFFCKIELIGVYFTLVMLLIHKVFDPIVKRTPVGLISCIGARLMGHLVCNCRQFRARPYLLCQMGWNYFWSSFLVFITLCFHEIFWFLIVSDRLYCSSCSQKLVGFCYLLQQGKWVFYFYLVQLIEHPILRIPNILFVYFLSIFSR